MTSRDISHQPRQVVAARTPGRGGFVFFASPASDAIVRADILVLRDATGTLVPARYMGSLTIAQGEEVAFELAGAYRIDAEGVSLASIIGEANHEDHPVVIAGHDWGKLGLPDGPPTRVLPVGERSEQTDVQQARQSDGYVQYASSRRLSIAPGDQLVAVGREGTVIAVDRRKQTLEVDWGSGQVAEVTFDEVEAQEHEQ